MANQGWVMRQEGAQSNSDNGCIQGVPKVCLPPSQ